MADFPGLVESQISPDAVLAELETVLKSRGFTSSPRLSRFLRYVVEQTLDGNAPSLKEYKLGLEVFDRGEDFDPRSDAVVRVEARQVRFKLNEYYSTAGANDEIVIYLPKGGYGAVFERRTPELSEPILQELPPQKPQLLAPNEAQLFAPYEPRVARRFGSWKAAVALAVLSALGAGLWLWNGGFTRAAPEPSVAVLPFHNLSSDPNNQYFSDGLTDEITGELSRVKNLRVIARASAFQFRGNATDLREVGRQLGVSTVLEGSVERYGDHVKIIAHLERVSDGSHLWAKSYERQTSDLFTVQSELAAAIAANLNATVVPPPKHVPPVEAHDLYLRGMYESEQLTAESLKRAEADFQRAIELDRGYAAAYAGMGAAVLNRRTARFRVQGDGEVMRASELLHKALEFDPEMSSARAALATIALTFDWDWALAERELQTGSNFGPNAAVEGAYAVLMTYQGRFPEADDHLRRALDLDPMSVAQGMRAGSIRTWEGRYTEAIEQFQRITQRYPKIIQAAVIGAAQQAAIGHEDVALQTLDRMNPGLPEVRIYKAMVLAHLGRTTEAYNFTAPFEKDFQNSDVPVEWLALVHANAGDDENAVTWLERSADRRESQVLCIGVNPLFKRLRGNPRFGKLLRRIGLQH